MQSFHGTMCKYSKWAYKFEYKYTLMEVWQAECHNYINICVSGTIVASSTTWHEINKKLFWFFFQWSICFFDTFIFQDENILFAQNRLASSRFSMQCVQSSTYAFCVCNSKVSFSEMWVMNSKLIKTGREIICIVHDNSYRFQKPQKLFRKNTALSESKCFTNSEVHIHVIINCQISRWQII